MKAQVVMDTALTLLLLPVGIFNLFLIPILFNWGYPVVMSTISYLEGVRSNPLISPGNTSDYMTATFQFGLWFIFLFCIDYLAWRTVSHRLPEVVIFNRVLIKGRTEEETS